MGKRSRAKKLLRLEKELFRLKKKLKRDVCSPCSSSRSRSLTPTDLSVRLLTTPSPSQGGGGFSCLEVSPASGQAWDVGADSASIVLDAEKENLDCASAPVVLSPSEQDDLLSLLGNVSTPATSVGPPIHDRIASNLTFILRNGLKSEDMSKLLQKYQVPENCIAVNSPKLNPLVSMSIPDKFVQRDANLAKLQARLGVALAATSVCLNTLLGVKSFDKSIIESLNDSLKIMSDIHFNQSQVRRSLIRSNISESLRSTLDGIALDDFLFGADLDEKVKASKSLEKVSKDLSLTKPKAVVHGSKNFRNPLVSNRWNRAQGAVRTPNTGGQKKFTPNQSSNKRKPWLQPRKQ
ncbi:uncharacterized protein LOC116182660 [Photinus pyralis]|uniref:uncharacterized protein LOC116182660 n=1 Tax=Photinus pyralis TaxID=7054 RepID=UPI001267125B|nr:uncharacterized protein LOC116182660 [Photinus pyralis]